MIIKPRFRGYICTTAHPKGCEKNVLNQIEFIKSKNQFESAKKVLIVGASTGFGLSSRIAAAFGSNAATIGVFFEKPPVHGKTATAGWYNTAAFEREALKKNLYAKSINGDAFSNDTKESTIELIKSDLGKVDLVIYSLASSNRKHPINGVVYRSVIKPIGSSYTNKTIDIHTGKVSEITIKACTEKDIDDTIAVMGGEDWAIWLDKLKKNHLLSNNFKTVAFSYIGQWPTEQIYRKGTIGRAKEHLEKTSFSITSSLKNINGKAFISVNKALVTQSSSAVPIIPLYISILYKVMKDKHVHEGCIEQMYRLFSKRLYLDKIPTDSLGRIRIDDFEMREDIQKKVLELWDKASTESIESIADLEGYRTDAHNLFGFNFNEIDYEKEVDEMVNILSI